MSSSSNQQQQEGAGGGGSQQRNEDNDSTTPSTTTTTTTTTTGSLLRQTLMTHDECFVYKVPPLSTASGYKANDWNLSTPIETCGFQVERRDNSLYLLFTLQNHTKLFALSCIDASQPIIRSVEPVTDSSRYFVCHIIQQQPKSANGVPNNNKSQKTALLGFGFRERDVAVDLLGNLQQFTKSIEREKQAQNMKVTKIPTLEAGTKMHIEIKGMKKHRDKSSNTTTTTSTKKSSGSSPFLLKKPPPPGAGTGTASSAASTVSSPSSRISNETVTATSDTASSGTDRESLPSMANLSIVGDDTTSIKDNSNDDNMIGDVGVDNTTTSNPATNNGSGVGVDTTNDDNKDNDDDDDDDDDFGDFQGA